MLSSSARRLQLAKERQHLTVRKKVRWCRAMPFQHFPKEIEIFKNARISVPTTRVFGKYPRVRQICPQMEKLIFLEIWKMNWGSAKATNHCGTFICHQPYTCADLASCSGSSHTALGAGKAGSLTANSRVHRLLTFDTRGLFFDSMGIFAHGAMSMIRVHSRCRDKSSTCLLSTRPSSTR